MITLAWSTITLCRDDFLQTHRHLPHLFAHPDDSQKSGNQFAIFRAPQKCFPISLMFFHIRAYACFAEEAGRNV